MARLSARPPDGGPAAGRISRRGLLGVGLGVVGAALLDGCGSAPSGAPAANQQPPAAPATEDALYQAAKQEGKVVWWTAHYAQSAADAACTAGAMDLLSNKTNNTTAAGNFQQGVNFDCKTTTPNNSNTNPGAIVSVAPGNVRTDGRIGIVHRALNFAIGRKENDVRIVCQTFECLNGQRCENTVDNGEIIFYRSAACVDGGMRSFTRTKLHDHIDCGVVMLTREVFGNFRCP